MEIQLLSGVSGGYIIIDIHLRFFNMPVVPWMHRQRAKRGPLQPFEGLSSFTGQLFEGTFVELRNQRTDTVVQLRQREEDLVAQPCQDPSLHHLHPDLCFGFITRTPRTGGITATW